MATYWKRSLTAAGGGVSGSANSLGAWSNDPVLQENGAAATTLPGPSDVVIIKANSSNLNINAGLTWQNIDFAPGWAGTFSGASGLALNAATAINVPVGCSWTYTGALSVTGGNCSLVTNGKSMAGTIAVNGAAASVMLADDFNSTSTLQLLQGTLDTNAKNINCNRFTSGGTLARTLITTTSQFTLAGSGATIAFQLTSSGLTADFSANTFIFTGAAAQMISGGVRMGTVIANAPGSFTIGTNNSPVTNFTRAVDSPGSSLILGNSLQMFGTCHVEGGAANPLVVQSTVAGTRRQLRESTTAPVGSAVFHMRYLTISDTDAAATAPWTAYDSTDAGNNLNINFAAGPPPWAPNTGRPKVNVAGSWVKKPAKVYIGGVWVEKPMKRWNGSAWVAI